MGTVRLLRQRAVRAGRRVRLLRPVFFVTLMEISRDYRRAAKLLQIQLARLRMQMRTTQDREELWHIRRKIVELTPILTQVNELAELTERYYERGYHRDEKYTL